MGKRAIVMILYRTINPSKHIRKKCPKTNRVKRINILVILLRKMKKIHQKEAGCTVINHQYFRNGDSLIKLYNLEQLCQISTEGDIHTLLSDGTLEEHTEVAEVEETTEELVDLENFAVLGEYKVGLKMQPMPTN